MPTIVPACHHGQTHAHSSEGSSETQIHGHSHGHNGDGGVPREAITLNGVKTQLFVDFPRLIAGQESPFSAHLTLLDSHLAVTEGRVVVELAGGGQPPERFSVTGPSSPGIFRPVVKPQHSVLRTVTVTLQSETVSETHHMGEFPVFAGFKEALGVPKTQEDESSIVFSLENQWMVPFRVAPVAVSVIRSTTAVFGEIIRPTDAEAWVVAPRAGRVTEMVMVAPGSPVVSGAPLFTLGGTHLEGADKTAFDLALKQADIRVKAARREVDRLRPLVSQGVVPTKRMVDAQTAVEEAVADQGAARKRLDQLERSQRVDGVVDGFVVAAPMGGTVMETKLVPGAWVSAGDPLLRIVDPARLFLEVKVPEKEVPRIQNVFGVLVRLNKEHAWTEIPREALVFVGTDVDPDTRTVPVRFRFDGIDPSRVVGMVVEARLLLDAGRNVLAVPLDAVTDDAGVDVVYVQTGGESFERRAVRLGVQQGDMVEVVSGLTEGEWIVVKGAYSVRLASLSTDSTGHGHAH